MSVYNTLINGCSDIANTIRELTGKTEKISPLDFDEEIRKIVTARDLLDKSITKYDFQDMTTIPIYAFYECINLSEVNCPNITNIGLNAFYNCTSLSNIELPDTVETIGTNAFKGSGLTEVILPPNLTKINDSVFNYCSELKSVTFNDKIDSIGVFAFRDCWSLSQDITLPESCKTIGQEAFRQTAVKYLSGYLNSIAESAFRRDSADGKGLETLVLKGDAVCTLISTSAFTNTPIAQGTGYIIIDTGDEVTDQQLVIQYRSDTNWSVFADRILSKLEYVNLGTANPGLPDIWG